jgi:hypothetical protein
MMGVMDRNLIWVSNPNDPTTPVGIEIPFDLVVDDAIRYIGTIDAICEHTTGLRNEENKTASRLDEAWREAFRVKFQPNGYNVAATLVTGVPITRTKVIGIKIKQTRSVEDFTQFVEERDEEKINDWYKTLLYTHDLATAYSGRSLDAPMFTHSCNRYFRPCGLIDLCSGSHEDQKLIYASMETTPLTPSERSIILGEKAIL